MTPPSENPRRVPRFGLLIPAAAAWVVAALATLAPPSAVWVAAAAVAVFGTAVAVRCAGARRAGRMWPIALPAAALAVACGAVGAGIAVQAPLRDAPGLPLDTPVAMTVRVESVSAVASNDVGGSLTERTLLHGTLVRARVRGREQQLAAPILAFVSRVPLLGRDPGALVRFTGRAQRADPTDDVAFTVYVSERPTVVGEPDGVQKAAARLRAVLVRRAKSLPGDGGALLPGLAIGDTSGVSRSLDADMKAASLSHLTAVSGANCAVITIAVFALAGLLRLPRVVRIALSATALVGFVTLVTPQPSVLRSAVMALLALGCLAAGRTVAGLPALSVAVIVLLVPDPWLARNAGFVLSVLATGGLLLLTRPIAARLARWLPERLALVLAVPIAAQIACEPVLILLQPAVPIFGVAANLLAEPAAPAATILGLLACLILPISPLLGGALAVLGWVPAAWIAAVARTCAALPSVPWPAGVAGVALAVAVVVFGVLAARPRTPLPLRFGALAVVAVTAVVVAGAAAGSAVGRIAAIPANWEIAACDVGQGDGLVLNGGGGHYVMIDTGRTPEPIAKCLARLGISHIELLILTHWDADHVGAARSLIGRVGTAFVGPGDGASSDELRRDLVAGGMHVLQVHRGDATRVGRLRIEVLWPPDPLGATEPDNGASITALVTGTLTSIFTGDLNEDSQNALLALGTLPHVDVVKVSHHGSADQSPAFYAAVSAGVGLISVGAGNDYHHPTARLLQILRAVGTQPIRTDQSGLILVSARAGGGVAVWTERPVTSGVWTPAR